MHAFQLFDFGIRKGNGFEGFAAVKIRVRQYVTIRAKKDLIFCGIVAAFTYWNDVVNFASAVANCAILVLELVWNAPSAKRTTILICEADFQTLFVAFVSLSDGIKLVFV